MIEATTKKKQRVGPRIAGGSPDARTRALAILDVLGGNRTPAQAAEAVGVSVARYFALESRALEGLVKACEPRPKGYRRPPEREIARLRREVERLAREVERRQALVRAAQRAVGLAAPVALPPKKRRKRPMVRALKAAAVLRSEPPVTANVPPPTS